MRINQFVAAATGLSRRAADHAVEQGRVTVDGAPANLGQTVTATEVVALDGAPLQPTTQRTYVLLNKPAGYISSRRSQGQAPTLYELLPTDLQALRPAGRLDRDSSGLVLLTDDGPLINRITHPRYQKLKTYQLTLTRPLRPDEIAKLEAGVTLTDGPSHVTILKNHERTVTVGLSEGRNRQLRRTIGALGLGIVRLHRLTIGPLSLDDLPSGGWKTIAQPDLVA